MLVGEDGRSVRDRHALGRATDELSNSGCERRNFCGKLYCYRRTSVRYGDKERQHRSGNPYIIFRVA